MAELQQLDTGVLATKSPELLEAILQISASTQIVAESPLGYLHHWLILKLNPRLRRATAKQDARIKQEMQTALRRLQEDKLDPNESALSSMLNRLSSTFGKDIPPSEMKCVHSELALMMHAGQKTTADTAGWALKYLAVHQVGFLDFTVLDAIADFRHHLRTFRLVFAQSSRRCLPVQRMFPKEILLPLRFRITMLSRKK